MSQTTTCRTCGASLAADQRYCLSCGTRVASPRLDFLAEAERAEAAGFSPAGVSAADAPTAVHASGGPAAGAPAYAPAPAPSRLDKVGGPMGAAAVVLVALGIGFLIGQNGDEQPVAQRAPVVNIQGGLPTGGATAAPTDVTVDDTLVDDAAAAAEGGAGGGGGRTAARRVADDAARVAESTRDIPKSTGESDAGGDITRLRAQPTQTATPGAPPPRDDEEAGGGTEAETIG